MTRFSKHIALVATLAFAVSTIGLPVVINYCTMQGTYRTGGACCACPSNDAPAGERIGARACIEHTELGAPISSSYTVSAQHVQVEYAVVAVIPVHVMMQSCSVCRAAFAGNCSGAPPPLLCSTILLI